jgi:hypothetical protein
MSLAHKFYCVPSTQNGYITYEKYYDMEATVSIHDDLIRYINDTLLWIPAIHLSKGKLKKTYGLSLYGVSVINGQGISIFIKIIDSWIKLFSEAPESFQLSGGSNIHSNEVGQDVFKFTVVRNDLITQLSMLRNIGEKSLDGEYCILHLGI